MNPMYLTAIGVCAGLVVANFIGQVFSKKHDWEKALERSFFQVVAIAIFLVANFLFVTFLPLPK